MIDRIFTSKQFEEVQKFLSGASRFVILTHVSPDGDAMGSSLGMKHYLTSVGKQATVIVPNAYPSFLAWMPGASDAIIYDQQPEQADEVLESAEAVICTDFNELKRIGDMGERVLSLKESHPGLPIMMIDHHIVEDKPIADILLSVPTSPSASELVYRLVGAPTTDAATCVYTGMMTDTGNFSFNSNHAEMYEIIADLVRKGVNKDSIYNAVFNQYSSDRIRLMGYCLHSKMRLYPEYHVAFISLSRRELYHFNFQSGDGEGLVNLPLQIRDVYYSCFMREDKDKIKISLRSQGDRPVNTISREVFHGGGHMNAAGGEFYGSLQEATRAFMDNFPKYFKKD